MIVSICHGFVPFTDTTVTSYAYRITATGNRDRSVCPIPLHFCALLMVQIIQHWILRRLVNGCGRRRPCRWMNMAGLPRTSELGTEYKHSSTVCPIAKCKRVARGQWPAGYIYRARSCYGITLALTCVHTPKCDRSIWVRAQYKRPLEARDWSQ